MEEDKDTLAELVNCNNNKHFSFYKDQYRTLNMIDYGSFGDIFKVRSTSDGKVYAMKQISYRGHVRDDPYIINEIMCLTQLKHDNIIRMHEILIKDCEIDIIMDYAEHENLERYYTQCGVPSLDVIHELYRQLLEGIDYCHSMDIAHRDLTPANILLTKDNTVKIADFGLAVRCFDDDGNAILCSDYLGNVPYLSPEVLSQRPFLPKPADIWSLGVVLMFMIYFDIPYKGFEDRIVESQTTNTWKEFQDSHSGDDKSPSLVSSVLERTLVVEPERRSSICELVRVWGQDDLRQKPSPPTAGERC